MIQKWLKAGVVEDGRWFETEEGAPQGSVISPILANLYLHYVLDVWAVAWRKKVARGDMIIVRYADDAVLGFQYREDAERFLEQLRERVRKFGLELHPDVTRLIEFGRYAGTGGPSVRLRKGSSDTEVNEFTLRPCGAPSAARTVAMASPVANCEHARRKSCAFTGESLGSGLDNGLTPILS